MRGGFVLKRKIFALILALSLAVTPIARAEGGDVPSVSAASWAVYDATMGRFLASSAGDEVRRMASTTKIMTALVALENFDLDTEVTVTREMLAEGSSMYLKLGETLALRDLLYGLMLMSGNDAALAVASLAEGSFVELMNERAKSLGLANTAFANPNGLDADGHHTTAKELALLAAEALKNDTFREIVSTASGTFAGRSMTNHNKLLRRVDGCIGVKTGYTSGAGRCLVSAFERGGRRIVITTLYAPNDWSDHEALCEWAFERYAPHEVVAAGEVVAYAPVEGGLAAQVAVRAAEGVTLSLSAEEVARLETMIFLPKFVYAPVSDGERMGELVVSLDGGELARVGLYGASVERAVPRKLSLREKLVDWLETLALRLGLC